MCCVGKRVHVLQLNSIDYTRSSRPFDSIDLGKLDLYRKKILTSSSRKTNKTSNTDFPLTITQRRLDSIDPQAREEFFKLKKRTLVLSNKMSITRNSGRMVSLPASDSPEIPANVPQDNLVAIIDVVHQDARDVNHKPSFVCQDLSQTDQTSNNEGQFGFAYIYITLMAALSIASGRGISLNQSHSQISAMKGSKVLHYPLTTSTCRCALP